MSKTKQKVIIVVEECVCDYEHSTKAWAYTTVEAARKRMHDECKAATNDFADLGWECECHDDDCICYAEPGDYSRNHCEWSIRECELDK